MARRLQGTQVSRQAEIVQALGLEPENAPKRHWRKWLFWGLALLLVVMLTAWVRGRHPSGQSGPQDR